MITGRRLCDRRRGPLRLVAWPVAARSARRAATGSSVCSRYWPYATLHETRARASLRNPRRHVRCLNVCSPRPLVVTRSCRPVLGRIRHSPSLLGRLVSCRDFWRADLLLGISDLSAAAAGSPLMGPTLVASGGFPDYWDSPGHWPPCSQPEGSGAGQIDRSRKSREREFTAIERVGRAGHERPSECHRNRSAPKGAQIKQDRVLDAWPDSRRVDLAGLRRGQLEIPHRRIGLSASARPRQRNHCVSRRTRRAGHRHRCIATRQRGNTSYR